jgi:hypothetical protein
MRTSRTPPVPIRRPAQRLTEIYSDFGFTRLGGVRLARVVYKVAVIVGAILTATTVIFSVATVASGGTTSSSTMPLNVTIDGPGWIMAFIVSAVAVGQYLFWIALLRVVLEVAVVVFDRREAESSAMQAE